MIANQENSVIGTVTAAKGALLAEVPGAAAALPTSTNRWVEITSASSPEIEFHPDWIEFSAFNVSADQVLSLFQSIVLSAGPDPDPFDGFQEVEGGHRFYQRGWQGHSIHVMAGPRSNCRDHVHVQLKGEACGRFALADIVDWIRAVEGVSDELKCSRLDAAWDYVQFSPEQLYGAIESENCRTPAKQATLTRCRRVRSGVSVKDFKAIADDLQLPVVEVKEGDTLYIGRHSSARELCVYNYRKDALGNNFTRCEFRMRQDAANAAWQLLKRYPLADWSDLCKSFLVGFVEFVDSTEDSNISRCNSRLPFWSSFVKSISRCALRGACDAIPAQTVRIAQVRRRRACVVLQKQILAFGRDVVLADLEITEAFLTAKDQVEAATLRSTVERTAEASKSAAFGSCWFERDADIPF